MLNAVAELKCRSLEFRPNRGLDRDHGYLAVHHTAASGVRAGPEVTAASDSILRAGVLCLATEDSASVDSSAERDLFPWAINFASRR